MRKLILIVAAALVLPLVARAGVPEAVTYLKAQPQDDWITQALVAAGESGVATSHLQSFSGSSVTDYAKRILAIAAVGQNPHTFAGSDLVAGLKGLASAGQLGDPTLLNDDAWGIIALRAASIPATDTVVTGAKDFLLAHQNADGGWAWGVGFDSDTNDTAAVLMALSELGYTSSDAAVANAIAYLATQQVADGGFVYQLPCFWPDCELSDSASTSWVVSALTKLKLDPATWTKGAATPLTFLATLQTGDGSFKWQAGDPAGSAGMTAYAVVALSNKFYPVARFVGGGVSSIPTPIADLALTVSEPALRQGVTSYTVTLKNLGPTGASEVVVSNLVPPGFTVSTVASSDGAYDAATNRWTMSRLNNYAAAALTIAVTPLSSAAPGPVSTTASASARELDFNAANNSVTITLEVPPPPPSASPAPQVLGESVATCLGTVVPVPTSTFGGFAVSAEASNLAWYWDAAAGKSYCLDSDASVRALFESLALGITNSNLENVVPGSALSERLRGRLLLQVESLGEVWYVDGQGGRTYLPPTAEAISIIHRHSLQIL